MNIDPGILGFSALTVVLTIAMGFWAARRSRTASDFFVAGRGVSVGWNAGALRGFGAYTIPDFAEGRYDSPVFRKIAVIFVLFIGFFYTMPQMKGAGTTLAYVFPGMPYWAGVLAVGAVITLNVALGGMKGITLVQAFQYWLKMFAISVPVFVLMAVYGHYGNQLGVNGIPAFDPRVVQ